MSSCEMLALHKWRAILHMISDWSHSQTHLHSSAGLIPRHISVHLLTVLTQLYYSTNKLKNANFYLSIPYIINFLHTRYWVYIKCSEDYNHVKAKGRRISGNKTNFRVHHDCTHSVF